MSLGKIEQDYCEWRGGSLPTEAQWEKVAPGTSVRAYPWCDGDPSCTLDNYALAGNYCVGDTSQLGSYPAGASPYGVLDMPGTVLKWVADWYGSSFYAVSPSSNPTGPEAGTYKVLCRGCWYGHWGDLRFANRSIGSPNDRNTIVGFRVASTTAPG